MVKDDGNDDDSGDDEEAILLKILLHDTSCSCWRLVGNM